MVVSTLIGGAAFKSQKPNSTGFVVIGAGLPRTGTSSTRIALAQLLDGACYHMADVFNGNNFVWSFWDKAISDLKNGTKTLTNEEWISFLENRGYRSGVDYPISLFYRELMEAFPDAKVVLTVRDNGEGWYKSVKESIYSLSKLNYEFSSSLFMKLVGKFRAASLAEKVSTTPPKGFEKSMFQVVGSSCEESVEFYNMWVEDVKRTVPPERLLIFNVKQGWKPLCEFLGLPVPDAPFPHVNDTKSMQSVMKRIRFFGITVAYIMLIIIATLGYNFREEILQYVNV